VALLGGTLLWCLSSLNMLFLVLFLYFMYKNFNKPMGRQAQVSKKVPWWSYKVKQGDANYALRTDAANNYMDFDSDQNFQIELHYQECCSGKK
jgi:hypothetical protein